MNLLTSLRIPPDSGSVRKLVLTDDFLIVGTVSGWLATVALASPDHEEEGSSAPTNMTVFEAEKLWDFDYHAGSIATANDDGTVSLWDVRTRMRKATLTGHTSQARKVVLPNSRTVISGSRDNTIIMWDAVSYERRSTLTGHRDSIACLKVYDNLLVSASSDGVVRLWDLNTASCIHVLEGHTKYVEIVCPNHDRSLLATGASRGDVRIWSISGGEELASCTGHTRIATQFSNTGDGKLLSAGADASIRLWDWTSGSLMRNLECHHGKAVRGVTFVQGKMVSGGMDGGVYVWDEETWEYCFELRPRVSNVYHFQSNGEYMAIALRLEDGGHLVELWDLAYLDSPGVGEES